MDGTIYMNRQLPTKLLLDAESHQHRIEITLPLLHTCSHGVITELGHYLSTQPCISEAHAQKSIPWLRENLAI